MKSLAVFGLAVAFSFAALSANAAELKSGPQAGQSVGAYNVVKTAGAPDDGVAVGSELCYRCKMGQRPVVMVFARKADDSLAKLVKELDGVVAKNKSDYKLASFVNLIGEKPEALTEASKKIVADTKAENVAFVVPVDQPNGPAAYNIDPNAETTVLIYVKGKVEANHALPAGGLNDEAVKKIVDDTAKILK